MKTWAGSAVLPGKQNEYRNQFEYLTCSYRLTSYRTPCSKADNLGRQNKKTNKFRQSFHESGTTNLVTYISKHDVCCWKQLSNRSRGLPVFHLFYFARHGIGIGKISLDPVGSGALVSLFGRSMYLLGPDKLIPNVFREERQ